MPLSPETKRELLDATMPAAQAFVEDLAYFREVLNSEKLEAADIRRLSNEVRRLLIDNDGDLRKIAAPRIGRFKILEPDNLSFYRLAKKHKFFFFGSGGVPIHKITVRALMVHDHLGALPIPDDLTGPTPKLTAVHIDNFLSQLVLCLNGEWVNRGSIIKYVANIAHGVHSGTTKTSQEKLIETIRRVASYTFDPPKTPLGLTLDLESILSKDLAPPFRYVPKHIDVTLVELLATVHFLLSSPDLIELERLVTEELRGL